PRRDGSRRTRRWNRAAGSSARPSPRRCASVWRRRPAARAASGRRSRRSVRPPETGRPRWPNGRDAPFGSALLERLEVVPHLTTVVERDGLLRQSLLHHLAILGHDAHRRQSRRIESALPEHVRVVRLAPALAHLALDADVERVLPQSVRGIAAPSGIRPLPGQRSLPLAEVGLVLARPTATTTFALTVSAGAPALKPLAAALALLLR